MRQPNPRYRGGRKYPVLFDGVVRDSQNPKKEISEEEKKRREEIRKRKEEYKAKLEDNEGIHGGSFKITLEDVQKKLRFLSTEVAPVEEVCEIFGINEEELKTAQFYHYDDIQFLSGSRGIAMKLPDGTVKHYAQMRS